MARDSTALLALLVSATVAVTACNAVGVAPSPGAAFSVLVILGSGVGGFSGHPAAGVKVTLTPSGGSPASQTTDANGRANFPTAPSGIYDISAAPPASLPAAALTIRDLNVATTGRDIVLVLVHRLPTDQVPPRPISGPFIGSITGTLLRADGSPQAGSCPTGFPDPCYVPGVQGIVSYTGLFHDTVSATGTFSISRPGMSSDRPAVTGSLFGGNWDGVGGIGSGVLGVTHLHFTQYAYDAAVDLVGPSLSYGNFQMSNVTGSLPTTLDSQGQSFLAPFNTGTTSGLSVTDLFLYHAIHSADLWLGEVYHDTGVTSVTTPIPQIPLDQGVYWYGLGFAGSLSLSEFTVFGITTTYLTTGASALNVSYLARPGNPTVSPANPPTVSWTASSGATVYEVDIFDAAGNLVYYAATSTSLAVTLPQALPAGSYTVQVFANDSLTSHDYIGRDRGSGPRGAVRGTMLRHRNLTLRMSSRHDRLALVRALMPVRDAFRAGGRLHRPFLDRTPFSNNDDRWSWSDEVAFSR